MQMTRKFFTRAAASLFFFNRFSGDILFSSLISFAFLILVFVCFLELKMYILIHIRLCRRVRDKKKFHPAGFRKQDYFFLALWYFPQC